MHKTTIPVIILRCCAKTGKLGFFRHASETNILPIFVMVSEKLEPRKYYYSCKGEPTVLYMLKRLVDLRWSYFLVSFHLVIIGNS